MSLIESLIMIALRLVIALWYAKKFLLADGKKYIGKKIFMTLSLTALGVLWRTLFVELKEMFPGEWIYRVLTYVEQIVISGAVVGVIAIDRKYESHEEESLWQLILLSCFPIFTVLWNIGYVTYEMPDWSNAEMRRLAFHIGLMSWVVFILLNYLSCILYYIMRNGDRERKENFRVIREFEIEKKHFSDIEKMQNTIRGVWHDLNNLLTSAEILLEEANYEGVKNLLTGTQERIKDPDYVVNTGNPAIDVILNWKIPKMKLSGLPIETSIEIPAGLELDYEMMVSILGNLMDNIIECQEQMASEKRKAILNVKYRNEMLILYAANSCEQEPTLKTTKEDTQNHGYGIANIKNAVEKMGGSVQTDWSSGMFETKILLYRICPKMTSK